ncbi:TetR/AcrR family transcriptional regulator [Actinospica robiniae]|uniref:TetR/AcrR family transcriptional regulator n=1 Tax=Actinospica robiniae TaxID=304901 RepID=UPI00040C8678|nr:TetR/AcrR family transcriptional regulator [Actinospica robiniae]
MLIAAARALFSEQGTDAPLDEVARRAGIGNATMYRHFPDRRELLIAVYTDEVEALSAEGASLLSEPSSPDALFTWLRAFITHVATKRDLALAIPSDHAGERSALFDRWHAAMHATAAALLARAQAEGTVHGTLDPADLLALASGIALSTANAAQADRCLALLREGATVHQR